MIAHGITPSFGVFDSGLGGVAVARALTLLGAKVVLRTDRAHAPYGDRPPIQVAGFAAHALRELDVLLSPDPHARIVVACNTATAALRAHPKRLPILNRPVVHLVDDAAWKLTGTGLRKIAVLATRATVAQHLYRDALAAYTSGLHITELAVPILVPLLESGASQSALRAAVNATVSRIPADTDAVVYGCTHFPLLDRLFAAVLGDGVLRYDPATPITKGHTE